MPDRANIDKKIVFNRLNTLASLLTQRNARFPCISIWLWLPPRKKQPEITNPAHRTPPRAGFGASGPRRKGVDM